MFGEGVESIQGIDWDWGNFESTQGFPVSPVLLDHVIGQDEAVDHIDLAIDEWLHKILWMIDEDVLYNAYDPDAEIVQSVVKVPASSIVMLGDPGTGKTLIGRALSEKLTEVYRKHKIPLHDILCWPNETLPSEPKISVHPAGEGRKIHLKEKIKDLARSRWKKWAASGILSYVMLLGLFVISVGTLLIGRYFIQWYLNTPILVKDTWVPVRKAYGYDLLLYIGYQFASPVIQATLIMGATITIMPMLILILGRMFFSKQGGIGGATQSKAPKLLVDNSRKEAPFIDSTGSSGSQKFGSITWDPWQSGGMGTPEHQRVNAGDVHRAHLGILYIDEIKNLGSHEATTLLTVLEEGELPITHRAERNVSGTAALSVATPPVPARCLLVAAGNFDSIPHIHPALMSRIRGYGTVLRMNNDMPNTVENRRKYVQFIAQELDRFRYCAFSREGCEEIIAEGRRRSNWKDRLSCKFRPLINIVTRAAQLAENESGLLGKVKAAFLRRKVTVQKRHVRLAVDEYCKSIEEQLLEYNIKERRRILEIEPEGEKIGQTYGLYVISRGAVSTGDVGKVTGTMFNVEERERESFRVTGIKKKDEKWIADSVEKVKTAIRTRYTPDILDYKTIHLDFAQISGVDGPSAGVTMAAVVCSLIEGRPLRQDVAMTGDINIGKDEPLPRITAIGGSHEKIRAAEQWGFRQVLIPQRNLEENIEPGDYSLEVVGCGTLDEYLSHIMIKETEDTA